MNKKEKVKGPKKNKKKVCDRSEDPREMQRVQSGPPVRRYDVKRRNGKEASKAARHAEKCNTPDDGQT